MNAVLRIFTWLLAIALVVLPVVAVVNGWIGAERWPLTKLRVHGEFKRVDPAQLRAVVLPHAQPGFFAVRLQAAQDDVEKLPWVERAEVRKRWPDVIEVEVVEHKPFARWGRDRLLSEHGRLFPIPKGLALETLPQLGGPDTQVREVVALFNESRELFAAIGLKVDSLVMDRRGSWSLALSNGTQIVVGRADARPRLDRFAGMLPQLLARNALPLQRADLRYTNGFALSWASGREQADEVKASAAADERPAMEGRAGLAETGIVTPRTAATIHRKTARVSQQANT